MAILNSSIQVNHPKKIFWPTSSEGKASGIVLSCEVVSKEVKPANDHIDLSLRDGSVLKLPIKTDGFPVIIQNRVKANNIRYIHNINIGFADATYGVKCSMGPKEIEVID